MQEHGIEKVERILNILKADYAGEKSIDKINIFNKPDKACIANIVHKLLQIVFPGYFWDRTFQSYSARNSIAMLTEDVFFRLNQQIALALRFDPALSDMDKALLKERSISVTEKFFMQIPKVREFVETDLQANFDGDPAAEGREGIILSYPGILASTVNRLAHELYLLKVPLIPRQMTEYAHTRTGIDIHPGATLGKFFFIDHGTGVVIGETTVIGDHVKLYQGVTLGALSTKGGQSLKGAKRHPTLEDNVTVYAGASILGGETVVGHGSVIGGNVFLTKSIPPETRVSLKNPELVCKSRASGELVKEEFKNEENWFYMI